MCLVQHDRHDRVSLELARHIAGGLRSHPEWIEQARQNLARWSKLNADSPQLLRSYDEWRSILAGPVESIVAVLIAETDEGQRLRQNSPFAGVLAAQEVWEIKRRFHATAPA